MERLMRLFGDLLVFVYHCFDRIVTHGYLSGLSRPEQVVHFVREVLGIPVVSKEVLSRRTDDYRNSAKSLSPAYRPRPQVHPMRLCARSRSTIRTVFLAFAAVHPRKLKIASGSPLGPLLQLGVRYGSGCHAFSLVGGLPSTTSSGGCPL